MIIIPNGDNCVNIMIPKGYSDSISITNAGTLQEKTLTINENGEYVIRPDEGYYALNEIIIRVNVK